jgi:hypothetical protein
MSAVYVHAMFLDLASQLRLRRRSEENYGKK